VRLDLGCWSTNLSWADGVSTSFAKVGTL